MELSTIITRELGRAGGGAVVADVPVSRKASTESLARLEREISSQIGENEAMCARSLSNAAAMAVK